MTIYLLMRKPRPHKRVEVSAPEVVQTRAEFGPDSHSPRCSSGAAWLEMRPQRSLEGVKGQGLSFEVVMVR